MQICSDGVILTPSPSRVGLVCQSTECWVFAKVSLAKQSKKYIRQSQNFDFSHTHGSLNFKIKTKIDTILPAVFPNLYFALTAKGDFFNIS